LGTKFLRQENTETENAGPKNAGLKMHGS